MDERKFIIYAVYHKPFFKPAVDFVVPIHAGKVLSTITLPFAGDDTGENISALNPNFCELTVLYWIWKNVPFDPADIWGLCHYRRYFVIPKKRLFKKKKSTVQKEPTAASLNEAVNDKLLLYMKKELETADAIVQYPWTVRNKTGEIVTIETNYREEHIAAHWEILKEVIVKLYPAYASSLETFCKNTSMSFLNMMVARASVWQEYLSWMFSILFEVKKLITVPSDAYQSRVFGFLSERLMSLYLAHNKVRVAYMPVGLFE